MLNESQPKENLKAAATLTLGYGIMLQASSVSRRGAISHCCLLAGWMCIRPTYLQAYIEHLLPTECQFRGRAWIGQSTPSKCTVRFLPGLAQVGVIRSYAGLRPWSPDHLPLVGPVSASPGFYLATGHEGAGIGLAPVTGQLIAGWVAGGDLPPVADEVRPDRFELASTTLRRF